MATGLKTNEVNSKGKISIKSKKRAQNVEKPIKKAKITIMEDKVSDDDDESDEREEEEEEEQEEENEESDGGDKLEEISEESGIEDLEELDDEMDVENISSEDEKSEKSGSGSESESEFDSDSDSDTDGEYPKLKKKKNLDDGSSSFANALNAIVGSKLKAYDRKDPILARNKVTLKKLESDKLEAKAKRALLMEKKQLYDKFRIKKILPSSSNPQELKLVLDKERKLKKLAQKGVVRLFNAVLSTQIKTNQEISQETVGEVRKEELMNEISKEKFLDLVQAAGDE